MPIIPSPLVNIESEIAPLQKVLIHTPGPEIENISPENVEKFLFYGTIFLSDITKDFKIFKNILSKVSQVFEVKKCLEEIFKNKQIREICINEVLTFYQRDNLKKFLSGLDAISLTKTLIEGLLLKDVLPSQSFSSRVVKNSYAIDPLPNLFFMRDTIAAVGNKFVSANMALRVRFVETILTRLIIQHHPEFKNEGFLLDAFAPCSQSPLILEGGDLHIWHKNLYLIGFSQRTSAESIDAFVNALILERKSKKDDSPCHVLVVHLPKIRSMIHLDMIFTQVSENQALAYNPALIGRKSFPTTKISIKGTEKKFEELPNLLQALKSIGRNMELIPCGGSKSEIVQSREQWVSGTNTFAFAPGKIISYENTHTLKALEIAGFKVVSGSEYIKNDSNYKEGNIVVTIDGSHLSQGGGGPRCMTCPILRC